jgi:hypothetical protein
MFSTIFNSLSVSLHLSLFSSFVITVDNSLILLCHNHAIFTNSSSVTKISLSVDFLNFAASVLLVQPVSHFIRSDITGITDFQVIIFDTSSHAANNAHAPISHLKVFPLCLLSFLGKRRFLAINHASKTQTQTHHIIQIFFHLCFCSSVMSVSSIYSSTFHTIPSYLSIVLSTSNLSFSAV